MSNCHAPYVHDHRKAVQKTVAIVGNPNCGKSTLFNALTGASQRVGNWPGVTVERKSGFCSYQNSLIEVVDLPGVYSLTIASDNGAADERIACEFILKRQAEVIINILDASNLERHLYLTTQLLEMGLPLILAVNMMDVARARGITIDLEKMSKLLGCPVIALEARQGKGLRDLKKAMVADLKPYTCKAVQYPLALTQSISKIAATLDTFHQQAEWAAIRLLEGDVFVRTLVSQEQLDSASEERAELYHQFEEDPDILLADARYRFVQELVQQTVRREPLKTSSWTARIDQIVLHRVLGIPIFLAVMYCMFLFAINIGGAFQDFFDIAGNTLFVSGVAALLNQIEAPSWLIALLADGVGKGVNTTLTFIPVIGALFIFLSLLEDSGYMARAAFVVDRLMRAMGLPGKAFVPMIVGFGCNVPAVMAARTLENKRDRILTIMMSPFMSCGARLAIFAVFTAAFFPHNGQNIVFALYLIGIFMAVVTGYVLRSTLLKGDPSPLAMELPPYHMPRFHIIRKQAWQRLRGFVFRAGRLIVPICVLIGTLNVLNIDGTMNAGEGGTRSLLSSIGHLMTPVFAPMGIHGDNWPATVGLITGVLAKEVVVGTLNTLYSQIHDMGVVAANLDTFQLWTGLKAALLSIPNNFAQLGNAFSNPVLAQAPVSALDQSAYGLMYQRFDGKVGAFAYLLFVLLYFPCVSTTAAMLRELNRGWAVFSVFWMTAIAYGTAVFFYQAATWHQHPLHSSAWLAGITAVYMITFMVIHWIAHQDSRFTTLQTVRKTR